MTNAENMLRLQALFSEAERVRSDQYSPLTRALIWTGCMAVNVGVWWGLIYLAARAIDLAKGY
jgi:hypothetical protein